MFTKERSAEFFNIITDSGHRIIIEAGETQTEWGTTFYEWEVSTDKLIKKMTKDEQIEYAEQGFAPVLSSGYVFTGNDLTEVIVDLFDYLFNNQLLD